MRRIRGFSLLELMIVLAVIAITLAWALPSYQESVRKARRGEAQALMRGVEVCAARWFTVNTSYVGMDGTDDCEPDDDDYYTYSISDLSATAYTVTATPGGSQADDKCGIMTINQTGLATAAKPGCWSANQTAGS
jgi:type IV pilus assembly protein PilE